VGQVVGDPGQPQGAAKAEAFGAGACHQRHLRSVGGFQVEVVARDTFQYPR
jgi:hypothetical protein